MTFTMLNSLKEQLMRHEGLRLKPYRCPAGKLTIGYGRNLDDRGISTREAEFMLTSDILECEAQLTQAIPRTYYALNDARKSVLVNMCFNLGIKGLLGFKNTLALIAAGDYERAANGMLASKWARQVGKRAIELAEQMRRGQ